jgi:hypothetical protein
MPLKIKGTAMSVHYIFGLDSDKIASLEIR